MLRSYRTVRALFVLMVMLLGVMALSGRTLAQVHDVKAGQWSGGAGIGFLGNTPDGVEFAFNGHLDYFISREISIGPLAQYAGAGDDFLFGLTAQGKYWWDFPGMNNQTKLVLQGGIGFVRAGIREADIGFGDTFTSFLIPVGVGIDHAVSEQMSITVDFLLNFTSLGREFRIAGREVDLHTNVMPGLYFGARF